MNTRILWIILLVAFAGLSRITDFGSENARRPAPQQPAGTTSPQQHVPSKSGPIAAWLFESKPRQQSSTGTAFKVGEGVWVTARHVVDQCNSVWIVNPNRKIAPGSRIDRIVHHPTSDASLVFHPLASPTIPLDPQNAALRSQSAGYHFGYPAGRPGDVRSRFLGTSRAADRGRRGSKFPIWVWAAEEIPAGLTSIGGLSGGPVFDVSGEIVGITIGENPRRGRVATTAPATTRELLQIAAVETQIAEAQANANPVSGLSQGSYQQIGAALRQDRSVIQLYCKYD